MRAFVEWLSATDVSQFIQNVLWIVPAVQCVHILAIAMVVSSVAMVDFRLLGWMGRGQSMTQTAQRFVPWIWWGLLVLAITGLVLIVGEPGRELRNISFWLKMGMLAVAIVITFLFQRTVRGNAASWDRPGSSARTAATKVGAVMTLFLWFAIAVAGRWIAYIHIDE